LFKSGNKETLSNYRPISIFSNFSKFFEKIIIKTRLLSYLERNAFLSKSQFGFRPGKSMIGALFQAIEFIFKKN